MATSLYAQQRLSLPDVDAIGYDVDGSWIDLYKKVGTDRYAQLIRWSGIYILAMIH